MEDYKQPDLAGEAEAGPPARQEIRDHSYYREPKAMSFFGKKRPWLNILLFVTTIIACFVVGITWSVNYVYADMSIEDVEPSIGLELLRNPEVIALSMLYAVVLIAILLFLLVVIGALFNRLQRTKRKLLYMKKRRSAIVGEERRVFHFLQHIGSMLW